MDNKMKKEAEQTMRRRFEQVKQLINKTGSDVPTELVVGMPDGYQVYPAPSPAKMLEVWNSVSETKAQWIMKVGKGWIPEEENHGEAKQENQEQEMNMRDERLPGMIKVLMGSVWFKDGTGVGVYAVIKQKEGRYIVTDTKEMKSVQRSFIIEY